MKMGWAYSLALTGAIAGCAHPPATVSAPDPSQSERRLQLRVEILQAEVRAMGQKVFACEQAYWSSMSPDWRTQLLTTKVQADHPGARIRHLEALQELLELDLKSLQSELRVYENFLKPVPPTVPRATPPAVPPRK